MNAQHTPTPWQKERAPNGDSQIWGTGEFVDHLIADELEDPVAQRIVSCVNACAGMADPEKDMAAIREFLDDIDQWGEADLHEPTREPVEFAFDMVRKACVLIDRMKLKS